MGHIGYMTLVPGRHPPLEYKVNVLRRLINFEFWIDNYLRIFFSANFLV